MSALDDQPWTSLYPAAVDELDIPTGMSLIDLLHSSRDRYADQTALTFEDRTWTFDELSVQSHAFAHLLAEHGFGRGDRLAIVLPNRPEYVFALFGTVIAGGIVVQVNHRYPAEEMRRILDDAGASMVITTDATLDRCARGDGQSFLGRQVIRVDTEPNHRARLRGIAAGSARDFLLRPPLNVAVDSSEVAVLQYTGGTTGAAKGVMLTHRNLVANIEQRFAVTYALFDLPDNAKTINVLPMCHVYGLTCVTLTSVRGGMNQILIPEFDAKAVLEIIRDQRPAVFTGVPTMYTALTRTPDIDASGLDQVTIYNSAGAGFPLEQIEQFEAKTGGRIIEGFGISEASPSTHLNPVFSERRVGSIGIPMPLTDVRIVDRDGHDTIPLPVGEVGEMIIRGPQVMAGYWNQPALTDAALREGWLLTGDLAHMDEDGYFYIDGRKKELIVTSGFNVYPAEVEQVLARYPGILEAAVIGVPDPYRGEAVCAYLVHDPDRPVSEADLNEHCRRFLVGYKVPREYRFVPALPRTPVGKIAKNKLDTTAAAEIVAVLTNQKEHR
ncbi:long-chain fatty acid--CoA ligase [Rhodococcus jostii]|uniref:Long-chain fatty acid--CoA ligase n=1 Tax=Rhodococcus jostii TaxID=132919 RepID=A0ABU4C9A4_RHOJO|nr:long-chain fatty acid--CoA ligase [Rhodococcus jostii]MDV6280134.1 long-chain fatty acid--CoA ligase [Rhodococcus jostii]